MNLPLKVYDLSETVRDATPKHLIEHRLYKERKIHFRQMRTLNKNSSLTPS